MDEQEIFAENMQNFLSRCVFTKQEKDGCKLIISNQQRYIDALEDQLKLKIINAPTLECDLPDAEE